MSQGLTWIAGRRTPLLALVALTALTVGLFTVLQSATAADGSVTVEIDGMVEITIADGYDEVVSANPPIATVPPGAPGTTLTVTGVAAGTTTITITDTDAATADNPTLPKLTYEVQVLPFGIAKVEFVDESDAVVKAGTPVKVRVTLQSQTATSKVRLTVPTTGLSIVSAADADVTTQARTEDTDPASKQAEWELYTAGAPDGEYTLTFTADRDSSDDASGDVTKDVTATAVLTIGDPGVGLASAALGPANVDTAGAPSTDANAAPDKTTKKAGSTIYLAVAASNSLGTSSNSTDVDQVIVFAIGADIGDHEGIATEAPFSPSNSRTFSEDAGTTGDEVGAAQVFSIRSNTPAVITVRATVIGSSGSQNADAVELIFTGSAETITLGDPSDQLGQKGVSITIDLTAEDDAGNPADISTIQTTSVKVLDADGKTAKNIEATEAQKQDANGNVVNTALTITVSSDDATNADTGAYTLEVKLGSKSTATAAFTVVGAAADVALEASSSTSDAIGDIITVTATVTDADGNAVTDKTHVNFGVSEGTGLAPIGSTHTDTDNVPATTNGPKTTDGVASVKFAVVGAGTSVVSATAGTATGVAVIISTAGQAAAVDEPDVEPVDGLSQTELNNFASWSGEGSVSASELLAGIADATGVLFYDGDSWQRYGVSDGQVIPGSRDFTIRSGQTIWISG